MRLAAIKVVLALVLVAIAGRGLAQENIYISDFRLIVDDDQGPDLQRTAYGAATFALDFLKEVGGVNFQATAVRKDVGKSISLSYDPAIADGHRLKVRIGDKDYATTLYDWEIKPIALYAGSKYTAVVSLFASGPDRKKYFYISYHPALRNTVLGLRLLQADMYLMSPLKLRALPTIKGKMLLEPGEIASDPSVSEEAAKKNYRTVDEQTPRVLGF